MLFDNQISHFASSFVWMAKLAMQFLSLCWIRLWKIHLQIHQYLRILSIESSKCLFNGSCIYSPPNFDIYIANACLLTSLLFLLSLLCLPEQREGTTYIDDIKLHF